MYQNIMIPVSFDEERDVDRAIAVAQALASSGARITFVHVIELIPTYVADAIPKEVWADRRASARLKLDEMAGKIADAQGVVTDGPAGRSITDLARDTGTDLIVMASHRPEFSDIFLGSTAAWVVRHADCAVHVIR